MRPYLAILMFFICFSLGAQLNDQQIYVDTKVGTWESFPINSSQLPKVIDFDSLSIDSIDFDATPIGNDLYLLNYKTNANAIGDSRIIIEYYDQGNNPGLPNVRFSTLHNLAKSSKVIAETDYIVDPATAGVISPLLNDSSTNGSVELARLGYIEGCSATINGDNIDYVLTSNRAEILYFVKDSLGNINSAKAFIYQEDEALQATTQKFTDNKGTLLLHLPSTEFTVSATPADGAIDNIEANIWSYDPDNDFSGQDQVTFSTPAGGNITYNIEVLNKNLNGSFIIDDRVYVATDGSIIFDALANDLKSNLAVVYHSPELTSLSNGVFEYAPPAGFSGDKVFIYKVLSGTSLYTGTITILVNDYAPINEEAYSFDIVEEQVLSIKHNTPITGFDFNVDVSPSNGTVEIINSNGSIATDCDTLTEEHLIVYTPNPGFTGIDEFDIEYCSASGSCGEIVKVDVAVQASNNTDCLCLEDCVFRGDHNDDGLVNIKDVLDLGLNVGSGGIERTTNFNEVWTGQYSNNWGFSQLNSNVDLKCGDSDGNGYIDEADLADIDTYYGNSSRLHSTIESVLSEVPIYFEPQSTDIDSGEYIFIDILVGDANFPAIDMQGLAFSLNVAAELMDSSSVSFVQADDSWLANESKTFDFNIVPNDGQVDVAISKAGRGSADGIGIVGTLSFIIEDELDGFRAVEYIGSLPISLNSIISTDYYGNYVTHPNYEAIVEITDENNSIQRQSEILEASVFPNPVNQQLNLSSNGLIDKIEVMDISGRLLNTFYTAPHFEQSIDLGSLQDGLYLIRIHSGDLATIQKVIKAN